MGGKPPSQLDIEKRANRSSVLVALMLGCVGFFLASVVIEHGISSDDTYSNWERFRNDYLRNTVDEPANVLVLGNSKSFRGIDTSLLNRLSAESECGLKFYNGSIPGLSSAEFIGLLDAVGANPNLNPRYVMFMPGVFRAQANLLTQRRRNSALIRLWRVNMLSIDARKKGARAYFNLHTSMLQRAANKSKLSRVFLSPSSVQNIPLKSFSMAQSLAGFLSLDDDPRFGLNHRRRLKFVSKPEAYEALASKLRMQPELEANLKAGPGLEGGDFNDSAKKLLSLYVDKVRSIGAEPVVVHFPELSYLPERMYYQKELPKILELEVDDQADSFLELGLWYDHVHFSKQGAELFTSLLFEQMCRGQSLI